MALRHVIALLFLVFWGVVEWCRREAQETHEEVQRLCGDSFFRRCRSLPDHPAPAWVGLPGAYSVWDLLRRRQQLEWAKGNLEYMNAVDWFFVGVAGFLSFLLVIHVKHLIRVIFAEVREIQRERALERISRLKHTGSSIIIAPKNPSDAQATKLPKRQPRPPSSVALLQSAVPDFIA